jgi:hypothetical protein
MEEVRLLSENVQMYAASGEEKPFVCIAFGGISKGLGTPVFEFMRTLSAAGVSSLFVKDPSQGWYQRPIEGLGNTPNEIAINLTELLRKNFPGKRVVAVGNSMGGFAAIAFGCLSGLDRAIAFSPQTFIGPELRQKYRDTRWQTQIDQIPKIHFGDLKPIVAFKNIKIDIYAGGKTTLDVVHAHHLDGMQNVHIHLLTECGHDASKWLREQGMLDKLILAAGMESRDS